MKQVSINAIERAIEKIDNLDDDGLERVAETYAMAQDILLGYVLSAAEEYQNQELEGLLVYYFCIINEAYAQEQIRCGKVNEDMIEEFEEPFFEVLDQYFETEDEDLLFDFTEQSELIRFMMMEVSTPDEDGSTLNDETATQLFIVTAALTTLLSRAIQE
ncbi:MAG: hypothetical protein EP333_05550 [Bacteroidetes bacterium]|nr:MAG: hypothetical protein EP333_05550 [Bacteroidota bacterium]